MDLLKSLFSVFQDQREVLDLASFDDELAFKISWNPLVGGGTNFCTRRLRQKAGLASDLLEFKITIAALLFSILFTVMGLAWLVFLVSSGTQDPMAIFGLAAIGFLFWNLWELLRNGSVFDRSSRRFAKGSQSYDLDDLSAIQLIREYVRGNKQSYYSYELNLVYADGERINIVDHGSLRAIREDAAILADYLQVPVWDAIDFRIPDSGSAFDIKSEVLRRNIG